MMTGFAWFCLALVALSVVCIFLGYPAIGGFGIATTKISSPASFNLAPNSS